MLMRMCGSAIPWPKYLETILSCSAVLLAKHLSIVSLFGKTGNLRALVRLLQKYLL
jgi:hypothetical protein